MSTVLKPLAQLETALHHRLGSLLIRGFKTPEREESRIAYGLTAGRLSLSIITALFVLKLVLGILSGSVSLLANAIHLISHSAHALVLIYSFRLRAKPATRETPFGHGRIEHVAPLIIAVLLFVSGIRIGEEALHQIAAPHAVHYWPALPWILLASILLKLWLSRFIRFLGTRTGSRTILATALHHSIEAAVSFAVILGLVAGELLHLPIIDGIIGLGVSLWILFLGVSHARHSLVPLLGQAPSSELVEEVRRTATSVEGVEDVHEVIVHDYGSMYLVSLHAEIPEEYGSFRMHEIAEQVEARLRSKYGGEAVCHTDPLMKRDEYIDRVEAQFAELVDSFPEILAYNDFRVIAKSQERIILVADLEVDPELPEERHPELKARLSAEVKQRIEHVAYSSFYIAPKFAY
jgi:cation diffusion facilitator family transporter